MSETVVSDGSGRLPFTDPVSGRECVLVPIQGGGVQHPGCDQLARVSIDLDAFYCSTCRYNGRISGAWVVDALRRERTRLAAEEGAGRAGLRQSDPAPSGLGSPHDPTQDGPEGGA